MKETTGKVVSVSRQWWLKVNAKAIRLGAFDGAAFPHVIKASYSVDGKEYFKKKWLSAGITPPEKGDPVKIAYDENKPRKAKIL